MKLIITPFLHEDKNFKSTEAGKSILKTKTYYHKNIEIFIKIRETRTTNYKIDG